MKRMWMLLLCLLLPLAASAQTLPAYQGDGRTMLTIGEAGAILTLEDGGELALNPGERLIATGEVLAQPDGTAAYPVYLPGRGYGVAWGDAALQEQRLVTYTPGVSVSMGLFTVDDPDAVRLEIVSLDALEYPVVTVQKTFAQPREDGQYLLCAAFATAADVCATVKESLCATLYGPDGQPIEVLTLFFDAPLWR